MSTRGVVDPFPIPTGIPTGDPGRARIELTPTPPPPAYLGWTSVPVVPGLTVLPAPPILPSATPDPTSSSNGGCCG